MEKTKVFMYCRVGTEEQLDIKKEDKPFRDISKYKPYKGFYDLREFDLTNEMFRKLWKIQEFLFTSSKQKDYLKNRNPIQWNNLRNMSAEYQRILLSHKLKENLKQKDDIELEM